MNICSYIDHTSLKPDTTRSSIQNLCAEAIDYGFAAVCVPPPFVTEAKKILQGSSVKTCTVIGFPFGYSAVEAKLAEIIMAIVDGVDELDIVINITALKNNDWEYLANEINALLPVIRKHHTLVKLIIESGILTDEEIIRCCALYGTSGVDFLKTSTGFAETGATVHAVKLMRQHLPPHVKIKASGGIRTYAFAKELIDAGAERIGCSAGIAIAEQAREMPDMLQTK
jgi:deoxyribose-phosphate aldolase